MKTTTTKKKQTNQKEILGSNQQFLKNEAYLTDTILEQFQEIL